MNRRDILGSLTLAATIMVAASAYAAELSLPGEPEIDQQPIAGCDQAAVLPEQPLAHGRIVAIDVMASRVTLEFQPIVPLLPEGGRHVFHVANAKSLKGLGPGDKVRFGVERAGRTYTLTRLEHSN
ncbi:MAG: copper-binding protein [Alphaproteobacteria bacterium]|nr:copper-binding protein [Alphaproteobacteria bacterium]MBV8408631.1 copper-binding protein [Alphaproteobacteria bacterium]